MSDTNATTEPTQKELEDLFNAGFAGTDATAEVPVVPETPTEPTGQSAEVPAEEVTPPVEQAPPNPRPDLAWLDTIEDEALKNQILELDRARQFAHQQFSANNGRINAYQRQILELKNQLSTRTVPTAPASVATPETPEEWQKLLASDPIAARAVEARVRQEVETAVNSVRAEMQELRASAIEPLYQHETAKYMEQEAATLDVIAPAWRSVNDSAEFKGWLDHEATPEMRALKERAIDHRDVMLVLNTFASDMISTGRGPQQQPNPQVQRQPHQVQNNIPTSQADQIAATRDRKLASTSSDVKAPPAPPRVDPNAPPSDEELKRIFEEAFKGK